MDITVEQTIEAIIQREIKELIEFKGAPYIKFLLIVTSIEFLGACLDQHPFEKNKESENRFNKALNKLFDKKYHKYAKADSEINLFQHLRCGMIHKLSPLTANIKLTERRHLKGSTNPHMTETNGSLTIVLEDFFEDLLKASKKIIDQNKKGKLPTKKLSQSYLNVSKRDTGHTETNKVIEN